MDKTSVDFASAQGVTDALQAALRYLVTIVGVLSGLGALIGKHDAAAAVAYVQINMGEVVAAVFGLIGLGSAAWGIYKTWKRGVQAAMPGINPDPNTAK